MVKKEMENKTGDSRLSCGLIMPISSIDGCPADHWDEVRLIIKESLQETNFDVELVSNSNEIGVIQNRIVNNIYKSDIVICDVSGKNPNVMFELGMRLAFDKPTIIIKDNKTNYSFDTAPIEHLEYPRDLHYSTIIDFKTTLKEKVLATYKASLGSEYTTFLKHFGEFKISTVPEKEITSENYILKAIDELKNSMARIEEKSDRKWPIYSSHKGKADDEIGLAFREVFEEYMSLKDVNEFDLLNHKVSLIPMITTYLVEKLGIKISIAKNIARSEIGNRLDDFLPF